jgi:hypothetical protein
MSLSAMSASSFRVASAAIQCDGNERIPQAVTDYDLVCFLPIALLKNSVTHAMTAAKSAVQLSTRWKLIALQQ